MRGSAGRDSRIDSLSPSLNSRRSRRERESGPALVSQFRALGFRICSLYASRPRPPPSRHCSRFPVSSFSPRNFQGRGKTLRRSSRDQRSRESRSLQRSDVLTSCSSRQRVPDWRDSDLPREWRHSRGPRSSSSSSSRDFAGRDAKANEHL